MRLARLNCCLSTGFLTRSHTRRHTDSHPLPIHTRHHYPRLSCEVAAQRRASVPAPLALAQQPQRKHHHQHQHLLRLYTMAYLFSQEAGTYGSTHRPRASLDATTHATYIFERVHVTPPPTAFIPVPYGHIQSSLVLVLDLDLVLLSHPARRRVRAGAAALQQSQRPVVESWPHRL